MKKEVSASVVYEDAEVMAFLDIRPLSVGHTLVIPKQHYVDIFDIPADVQAKAYAVVQKVAFAVKKVTGADGISVIQQNGKAAGQDIFHLHVHIIPRFTGKSLPRFSDVSLLSGRRLMRWLKK